MDPYQDSEKNRAVDVSQGVTNPSQELSYDTDVVPPTINQHQIQTTSQAHEGASPTQNSPITPRHVRILPKICLAIGGIAMFCVIISFFGLSTGAFLSNQGVVMASSLLMGGVYYSMVVWGQILCVITTMSIFIARHKYHTPIKKPLAQTIIGMLMVCIPGIIVKFL